MRGKLLVHIEAMGSRKLDLPEERCRRSGKRVFPTQESADAQASEWAHHNSSEYSSYRCPSCSGWHLTRRFHSLSARRGI